jgi:DNA-binding LytR/AlgR family response regulator
VSCLFKTSGGYFNIQLSTIAYFYAERRFIYAKVGKERLPIKLSIQDLAATMPGYFIRIHRSYIVNVNHIKQIRTKEKEVLVGDTQLPIGYKYKQGLFRKIHLLK